MSCRTCKDLGWIEVAKDDLRPCLACNNIVGPTTAEVIALAVGFIGLFILMLSWGNQ